MNSTLEGLGELSRRSDAEVRMKMVYRTEKGWGERIIPIVLSRRIII